MVTLKETSVKELKKAGKEYNEKVLVKLGWSKAKLYGAIKDKKGVDIKAASARPKRSQESLAKARRKAQAKKNGF
jgi:hypothetical protein